MRLGHSALDDDHEHILSLAANLEAAVAAKSPIASIRTQFKEMSNFSIAHFQREEQLMREAHYPGLGRHKLEHEEIGQWFTYLERALAESHSEVLEAATSQTLALLQVWIDRHLSDFDGPAIRYMLSKTTTPPLESVSNAGKPS